MSAESDRRSDEFLKISDQFQLGALTTEASHPATANLSEVARASIPEALKLLFAVDADVLKKYQEFAQSDQPRRIADTVLGALNNGGKLFFSGCGSTGRLSIQLVSIWCAFWQRQTSRGLTSIPSSTELEQRALSVMAGGDYALIKAVEGFEDFTAFGKKQIGDLGVSSRDVVFAITEGGETSFVIGTAWKGVEAGAKVYFVYNNPDEVLRRTVERSREVIEDPRIEKVNLTTGPMAITGSTRMQATTIQLCVMLTILEMVARELMGQMEPNGVLALPSSAVPDQFANGLAELQASLKSDNFVAALAKLVSLEEMAYRAGHKNNYFADALAIDVLTDTTERSPTYCTPAFRKFDDQSATESLAFLFTSAHETRCAWEHIIKREPVCIDWKEPEIRELVSPDQFVGTRETVRKIGTSELLRFKVGLDGLAFRPIQKGDITIGVVSERERSSLLDPAGFHRTQLEAAHARGARLGILFLGHADCEGDVARAIRAWNPHCEVVTVPVPRTDFLLEGLLRVCVKTVLNSLSTCIMVRLGRVMGNYMVWVVPSNLKLIDRATRYIQNLTGLAYAAANRLLFEVVEYVTPRMKADQAYPPVVGLAVIRARERLSNEQAEQRLKEEMASQF